MATPSTMQGDRVAQLLPLLAAGDNAARLSSEQELREMETQAGFTAHLMAIGSCRELEAQTRWLAVVYLKNQVKRFWQRRTGIPYEIPAEEKAQIRSGCLPLSLDADEKIATQSALVVARIVRFDYPRVWTEIMPMIAQAVEQNIPAAPLGDNGAGIQVTRVLHYCLKELSTKRLLQDRRAFFQVAPAFLSLMLQFWSIHQDALGSYLAQACAAHQQGAAPPPPPPEAHLRGFLLATKVLRRILVTGFARLQLEASAPAVLSTLVAALDNYHAIHALNLPHPIGGDRGIASRGTYFLGKLVAEIMENHPLVLCAQLEKILTLLSLHLQLPLRASDTTAKGIRLVMLRTLSAAIRERAFVVRPQRGSGGGEGGGEAAAGVGGWEGDAAAAESLVASFVSGERVAFLCGQVVLGALKKALKMEVDEAEELLEQGMEVMHAGAAESEDGGEELSVVATSCVDYVLQRESELGLSALLQLHAQGAAAAGSPQAEEGAMVREAVYHSLGASAALVVRVRGASAAPLAQELVHTEAACAGCGPAAELALKRAVWMTGRFVSADLETQGNSEGSEVSASLLPLLHELVARHPSLAVRVAAGSALSQEGEEESIDVLGGANSRLRLPAGDVLVACRAVAEAASGLAQLSRTKLQEGESARLCVEGMQMAVRLLHSIAGQLRMLDQAAAAAALPDLLLPHFSRVWAAVGDNRRLQVSLTRMLTEIMSAELLRASSDAVCHVLASALTDEVFAASVTADGGMCLVLLDAVADLWAKLLRSVSTVNGPLLDLLPRLVQLVGTPKGPREVALRIAEAYLLLAPPDVAAQAVPPLVAATTGRVDGMTMIEMRCLLSVCEVGIIKAADEQACLLCIPLLVVTAREVFFTQGGTEMIAAAWFSCVGALTFRAGSSDPLNQLVAHINAANARSQASPTHELTHDLVVERWFGALASLVSLERSRHSEKSAKKWRLAYLGLGTLLATGSLAAASRVIPLLGFASEVVSEEEEDASTPRTRSAVQLTRNQLGQSCYSRVPGGLASLAHLHIRQGRESLRSNFGDTAAAALDQQLSLVDPVVMQNLPFPQP